MIVDNDTRRGETDAFRPSLQGGCDNSDPGLKAWAILSGHFMAAAAPGGSRNIQTPARIKALGWSPVSPNDQIRSFPAQSNFFYLSSAICHLSVMA